MKSQGNTSISRLSSDSIKTDEVQCTLSDSSQSSLSFSDSVASKRSDSNIKSQQYEEKQELDRTFDYDDFSNRMGDKLQKKSRNAQLARHFR